MQIFRQSFLFIPLLLLVIIACKENRKQEKTVNLDSLRSQYTILNDSLATSWNDMIASDDQKLRHIQTLLWKIDSIPRLKVPIADSAAGLVKTLPEKRYQNVQELTLQKVDAYDAATDTLFQLLGKIDSLVQKKGCKTCQELIGRIRTIDSEGIMYRIRYDRHAQAYNAFIQENKENLLKINPKFDTLVSKPVFQQLQ